MANTFTIQKAKEASIGQGANGYGKRVWVHGFYVVSPAGRKVRAFTGQNAETEAQKWADYCTEKGFRV